MADRNKIKSVLASYLKGEITSIDDAVEQVIGCMPQREIVSWQYRVRTPDNKGWFGWDMVRRRVDAFRQQHAASIAAGVTQLRPLYADQETADAAHAQSVETTDAAARYLAEWFGYSFDGLREGRVSSDFKPWGFNGIGQKEFQGGQQDVRDAVAEIVRLAKDRAPTQADADTIKETSRFPEASA